MSTRHRREPPSKSDTCPHQYLRPYSPCFTSTFAERGNHRTMNHEFPCLFLEPVPDNIFQNNRSCIGYVGSESTSKPPETQLYTISPRRSTPPHSPTRLATHPRL